MAVVVITVYNQALTCENDVIIFILGFFFTILARNSENFKYYGSLFSVYFNIVKTLALCHMCNCSLKQKLNNVLEASIWFEKLCCLIVGVVPPIRGGTE